MKTTITTSLIFFSMISSCQIHWSSATNWTLYAYPGTNLFKVSLDSLKTMDTILLNKDSMDYCVSTTKAFHRSGAIIWMGGYVATCKVEGLVRKIDISNYGAFFYDERTKTYYQIQPDRADIWNSYLQQSFLNLSRKQANRLSTPQSPN